MNEWQKQKNKKTNEESENKVKRKNDYNWNMQNIRVKWWETSEDDIKF